LGAYADHHRTTEVMLWAIGPIGLGLQTTGYSPGRCRL